MILANRTSRGADQSPLGRTLHWRRRAIFSSDSL